MICSTLLKRYYAGLVPGALLAGIGFSALVGWYASTATGLRAGLTIFALLGAITLVMTWLLAWALRRAEAALAEAHETSERLRELLELSSDWYWEQDEQFRFTAMSGGVFNKGNFRIDDSLGKTRWELPLYEPDPETWRRHREQLARHEPFRDLRYAIKTADGSVRTYSVDGRPRFDASGKFVGYRGVGHDITNAVQSEQALRRSEAQLVKAQEVAQTGSWELDIPGNRLTWSDETYRIFGIAAGIPLGYTLFMQCMHPDDRASVDAAWQAAMAGAPYDIEHRILVGGTVRWVRERAEIVFDAAGQPVEGIGTVQDITERKEAELKLRLAASVFENSLEGVTITDAERNIISVNRAFTRITGYEPAEVIGKNPRLLASGRQDTAFYASMWQAIEQNGSWSGEVWNRRKDGEIYPELLSIAAIRDERGCLLHYIGIFTDITDIKRAEEAVRGMNANLERRVRERTAELEASNRELEAFSYSVSHDLRAPLRGIDGFAHVLAEDYGDRLGETGRGYLQRIRQASQRLSQTIDDMIDLARITREPIHRSCVDLSALARAIVLEMGEGMPHGDPAAKEEGKLCVRHRPEMVIAEHATAQADPALLRIVLENLLDNAWKFTGRTEAPRIEFGMADLAGESAFFIRDNGAGFDPAFAGKLFQPFQRLHRADEFFGTGIGLATVQRIVQRHGGRAWAESAPGRGATFYFTLP